MYNFQENVLYFVHISHSYAYIHNMFVMLFPLALKTLKPMKLCTMTRADGGKDS